MGGINIHSLQTYFIMLQKISVLVLDFSIIGKIFLISTLKELFTLPNKYVKEELEWSSTCIRVYTCICKTLFKSTYFN